MSANKHLLYIEDDLKSREIMRLMMTHMIKDCTLTVLEGGNDFLNQLRCLPTPPDLILMDIQMYPLDGFGLLAQLRSQPAYMQTPVVALTASVMSDEVERIKEGGFDGIIAKPISPHVFPGLITRLLKGESVWHVAED